MAATPLLDDHARVLVPDLDVWLARALRGSLQINPDRRAMIGRGDHSSEGRHQPEIGSAASPLLSMAPVGPFPRGHESLAIVVTLGVTPADRALARRRARHRVDLAARAAVRREDDWVVGEVTFPSRRTGRYAA